ncbi:MAG: hypothetical protein C0484_13245 [Rhodospirillum sp.]|nr:hypothetical protein [Rhodospirillum sp.]
MNTRPAGAGDRRRGGATGAALGIAILYRLVASLGDGIGFIAGSVAEMRPHTDTAGSGRYSSPED